MNTAGVIASIRAQGYAVVPRILPPDLVAAMGERINELRREDEAQYGKEYLYRIGQEGFIVNLGDRGEAFERLLTLRPAMDVVDALLGPGAFLYLFQGVIVPPGGGLGAYPWKWHCDLFHVVREVRDRTFIPGVNCLFFIDDVDNRNGGTWIFPGSQGLTPEEIPYADAQYQSQTAIQVSAPAGSVVMFNPLLWHCAGANHTRRDRRAVKMLMVRDWLMPQMDYSRSVRSEVLSRLDTEARRILGHQRQVARSFEEVAAMSEEW